MFVISAGHKYQLHKLDDLMGRSQYLAFVKRVGPKYPGNDVEHPGTTCQEVLRAVVDRLDYVGHQIPCWETSVAKFLGGTMIWLLERRAARRHGRRAPGFNEAITGSFCLKCGHVGCQGGCH